MIAPEDGTGLAESKQRLVIFAPYPPAKSGIADYVAELMPYQMEEFDVTLVIADDAPLPPEPGPRTLLASEFRRHRAYFEHALKLYHIGNNAQHCYMLDFTRTDPGIVVLHDFNLGYLHELGTLRWGESERYSAAMEREYGVLGRDLVRRQFEVGFRELFAGYELPLNGQVLERATAVITHSRQIQYKVAARIPGKPVWYLPHHLSPSVSGYAGLTKAAARRQLGLPAGEIVVTALGFVTRAKQIPLVLAALGNLRGKVPAFRFVLAGERRPDEYDVDADIAESGLSNLILCTDYLDEPEFFQHLAATDIVVNLRYPSGGEMSGTLIRALGMGMPTIVLDYGPMGELPRRAVRKIAWDHDVQASLTATLRDLMMDAPARRALGASAAAYARSVHGIKHVAKRYSRILRASGTAPGSVQHAPLRQYLASAKFVVGKIRERAEQVGAITPNVDGQLWWRAGGVPLGAPKQTALVVSARPQAAAELLSFVFEWDSTAISTMTLREFLSDKLRNSDGAPIAAGGFAFALVVAPADLPEMDAALLMRRLNVALRVDASLIFETAAPENEGPHPDAPLANIAQRLSDAGFASIRSVSSQDGFIPELTLPAWIDDDVSPRFACAMAHKASDYAVWRFVTQFDGLPMRWGGRTGAALHRGDSSARTPATTDIGFSRAIPHPQRPGTD